MIRIGPKTRSRAPARHVEEQARPSLIGFSRREVERRATSFESGPGLEWSPLAMMARRPARLITIGRMLEVLPAGEARELVAEADSFADSVFAGHTRKSGEPTINHPRRVALRVCHAYEVRDPALLAAALLHDTIEDTERRSRGRVTHGGLRSRFGQEVADLVEGLTKVSSKKFPREDQRTQSFIKLMIGISEDLRLGIVKPADNSDNMRNQAGFLPHVVTEHSLDTLEIHAPVAEVLGIWGAKTFLEERAARYLCPDVFKVHLAQYRAAAKIGRKAINRFMQAIGGALIDQEIAARVELRHRELSEAYAPLIRQARVEREDFQALLDKNIDFFEELLRRKPLYFNQIAIVVDDLPSCFQVEGLLSSQPDKFQLSSPTPRNFIALPQPNNYRALHFDFIVPGAGEILVTVASRAMDLRNRIGVCALFQERGGKPGWHKADLPLIASIVGQVRGRARTQDIRWEVFRGATRIKVRTPRMVELELTAGSTALDFAFKLEDEKGVKAGTYYAGAWVNGRKVTDHTAALPDGAVVEIKINRSARPRSAWLLWANSETAGKIREYLGGLSEREQRRLGREDLDLFASRYFVDWQVCTQVTFFAEFISHLTSNYGIEVSGAEELDLVVGRGDISPHVVGEAFNEFYKDRIRSRKQEGQFRWFSIEISILKNRPGLFDKLTPLLAKHGMSWDRGEVDSDHKAGTSTIHMLFPCFSRIQMAQLPNIMTEFLAEIGKGELGGEVTWTHEWREGEDITLVRSKTARRAAAILERTEIPT
ncbi:HD domain-containing protein [Candidatus Margulisiibacteriota bacterium]